jgi:crotonobetainyl-CoA:carnitine CoA-transferase CaiB-like acyl-CoA transferase
MSVPQKSFEPGAECPLDGVRVIDTSRLVSGNMVSLQLADFGAEVLKIEDPNATTRCARGRPTASAYIGRSIRETRRAWH